MSRTCCECAAVSDGPDFTGWEWLVNHRDRYAICPACYAKRQQWQAEYIATYRAQQQERRALRTYDPDNGQHCTSCDQPLRTVRADDGEYTYRACAYCGMEIFGTGRFHDERTG